MAAGKPAFEELYGEYVGRIYAFLRAQLGNPVEAEDVTSQVFVKAFEAYERYEPRQSSPAAWLFQIARNAALDQHRRASRRERLARALARHRQEPADPAQLAEERILHADLLQALAHLPQRQREVVGLRHSGLSFSEVGELMSCSEDAAKMLYHRALRALRGQLATEEGQ